MVTSETLDDAIERGLSLGTLKEVRPRLKYEIEAHFAKEKKLMKLILLAFMSLIIFIAYAFCSPERKEALVRPDLKNYCSSSCENYHASGYSIDPKSGSCMCWLQYPKREEK